MTRKLTLDHLDSLLRRYVRLQPSPGGKVALVFDSGYRLIVDRRKLKTAIRSLASRDLKHLKVFGSLAKDARERIDRLLRFSLSFAASTSAEERARASDRRAGANAIDSAAAALILEDYFARRRPEEP